MAIWAMRRSAGWPRILRRKLPVSMHHPLRLAPKPAAAPPPPAAVDRSAWPQAFGEFAPWWLADPWLDEGRTSGRVPPRGVQNPDLMILVAEPEREDGDSLLSGPQGRLLGAMLAAMGIAAESTYLASLLPRPMPHADWNAIAARGPWRTGQPSYRPGSAQSG